MKKLKMISVMLAVLTLSFNLAACKTGGGNANFANTLYVGNYEGGLGSAWLREVADKFEAENPGIKVEIDEEKDRFGDSLLLKNIKHFRQDVYFLNQITYSNYVKAGVLADITDVVTAQREETYNENNEIKTRTISIENKMDGYLADYYKTNGKYYAVPFYSSVFGAVYDVDLFDSKKYYFKDGYVSLDDKPFVTTLDKTAPGGKRTAGVDGIYGTSDDGLPATYEELFALLDYMKLDSVIPFMWNGQYYNYRERYLASLWADYEGKDGYNLNTTFRGKYDFPAGTLKDAEMKLWGGTVTEDGKQRVEIKDANAFLLQRQPGKKLAVEIANRIITGGYYRTDSFETTSTHLMAQANYLYSRQKKKPVAFILEGSWWEGEARNENTFSTMASKYNSATEKWGYGERRFAFLPIPKAEGSVNNGRRTVLSASGGSVVCINAKTKKLDLAKKFFEFAHTDESLRTFTRVTGVPRAYEYELSNSDLSKMTYFSRDLWDIYRDEKTDVVYHTIFNSVMRSTEKSYFSVWAFGASNVRGLDYQEPFLAFRTIPDLKVSEYLGGMETMYTDWNKRLSNYLK